MSISRFPQSQSALVTAFQTIATHLGGSMNALDKLSDLEGAICGAQVAYDGHAVSVACPASTALAAFLSGALKTANGAVTPAAGLEFILSTTQDTSDTAFATAKGSAPAVGDKFVVTGSGSTVGYLGTTVAALDAALQPYTYRGAILNRE